MNLKVRMGDLEFNNPLIAASGTFGFGREFSQYYDLSKLGGISSKGLTFIPKSGNDGIRVWETPSGMMNSIGLENPGVENFIKTELDNMMSYGCKILANLGGNNIDQYLEGVKLLNETSVDAVELNISCPNVKEGGMAFGIKCASAEEVVSRVRKVCKKPLIVKLSPNAENIVEMAKAVENAGADGISLVNTFSALAINIYTGKCVFDNITAGLSGPAIKPIALRMVRDVARNVKIPVSGMGGIVKWEDAIEFIMAGASTVQVGVGNFLNPYCMLNIIDGIEKFMRDKKINSLDEIRGII